MSNPKYNGKQNISNTTTREISYYRQSGTTPVECWYYGGIVAGTIQTANPDVFAINTLHAVPYIETRGGTLDRIAIEVTLSAASAEARLGIYKATSDNNFYPGDLLLDAGTVDCSTTGIKTITISQTLNAGLYFFVQILNSSSATVELQRFNADNASIPIWGYLSTTAVVAQMRTFLRHTQTYGALPATFPTSTPDPHEGYGPMIAFRYSS